MCFDPTKNAIPANLLVIIRSHTMIINYRKESQGNAFDLLEEKIHEDVAIAVARRERNRRCCVFTRKSASAIEIPWWYEYFRSCCITASRSCEDRVAIWRRKKFIKMKNCNWMAIFVIAVAISRWRQCGTDETRGDRNSVDGFASLHTKIWRKKRSLKAAEAFQKRGGIDGSTRQKSSQLSFNSTKGATPRSTAMIEITCIMYHYLRGELRGIGSK